MAPKILAVDDESDILMIIRTALESEKMQVFTASNGYDALALAEEQQPDLIILDIMMPEMDGFEVLDNLRAKDATQEIPVVMLTGLSDKKRIKDALDKGVVQYIVKPFEYQEIVQVIHRALESDETDIFTV